MKFVIVYDSVSKTRMTEKVAVIIQDGLKEKGIEAEALHVNHADGIKIEDYDCLIIGSPTMGWRPTKDTVKFLDGLKGKNISGKFAASFDTQMKSFMSGNANKAMEDKLKELGFKIVKPPLLAYVHGGKDKYQLRDGESEKAKEWAIGLIDTIGKK
ncbi:MAG: flavodoxin domain-containing protein [Methanomassiliicoccales archaeon]|jgi:flavodoxin